MFDTSLQNFKKPLDSFSPKIERKRSVYIVMSSLNAFYYLCSILANSQLKICETIKSGKFNEQKLYKHFKNTAKIIQKFQKIIQPKNDDSINLPKVRDYELPPVKWSSDKNEFYDRMENYEKKYRKQVKQEINKMRAARPSGLSGFGWRK